MQTLLLSLVLASILEAIADRVSRPLVGVDASKTLWGTLFARTAAWLVAWLVTQRVPVPEEARRR